MDRTEWKLPYLSGSNEVDLNRWLRAEVDAECRQKVCPVFWLFRPCSVSICIFVLGFGCPEGRFELKLGCRKQPCETVGPSRARCAKKYGNMTARGRIWEHLGDLRGLPGRLWTTFWMIWMPTWCLKAVFFSKFDNKCYSLTRFT